MRNVSGESCR